MACVETAPPQELVAPVADDPAAAACQSRMVDNPAAARPLLSVAPMMDWTDVHFRQLARLLSARTWLWTEMVVDKTIIHTQNLDKFLWFPPEQRPLVLQLGGSDPATLAAAAAKAAAYGYDEINLNCGCPSDRVAGAGCFGASLMLQPALVATCMAAIAAATAAAGPGGGPLPLSVKCRLGVDEDDAYEQLAEFVRVVSEGSPVRHFIVHARKAYLNGLSPHQNRTVPPLRHQWAWALARDFPHLQFSLNGGILGAHEARSALLAQHPAVPYTRTALPPSDPAAAAAAVCSAPLTTGCTTAADGAADGSTTAAAAADNRGGIEGVMIGRGAYNDPWGCLADADRGVYGEAGNAAPSRRWVLQRYREYAEPMVGRWAVKSDGHCDPGVRTLMRPLLNLFHGEPGCKRWKAAVDEILKAGPSSFGEVLDRSLHLIPDAVLDAPPRTPDLAALPPFPLDPELPSPTSRAGHHQGPPGSKPPRPAGKGKGKAAAAIDVAVSAGAAADGSGDAAAPDGCAEGRGQSCEAGGGAEQERGGQQAGGCAAARQAAADAAAAAAADAAEASCCDGVLELHPQDSYPSGEERHTSGGPQGGQGQGQQGQGDGGAAASAGRCCGEAAAAAADEAGDGVGQSSGGAGSVPGPGAAVGGSRPRGASLVAGAEGGGGGGAPGGLQQQQRRRQRGCVVS